MTAIALPTLFVGDAQRDEFREAARRMIERGAVAAADIETAQAMIREGFAPALVVIAQSWPGRFSERQIDALRRAAPLARITRLLGTWMDGHGRTGTPSPATVRTNWQQWHARETADLSTWSLPVTANEDDRLLAAADAASSNPTDAANAPRIAVRADVRETVESLTDLCAERGWNAIWLRDVDSRASANIDCAIFDARESSANEIQALANLQAALGQIPIVALVGFPRIDDLQRFQSAGAAAVVAKPYMADDLVWQIAKLLPQSAARLAD